MEIMTTYLNLDDRDAIADHPIVMSKALHRIRSSVDNILGVMARCSLILR